MKNSETDTEFFDLIKNTLDKYEEQYILGSWENYVKQKRKKKKFLFRWISTGIAASLILGWLSLKLFTSEPSGQSAGTAHSSDKTGNLVTPPVTDSLKSLSTQQRASGINGSEPTNSNVRDISSGGSSVSMSKNRPNSYPATSFDAELNHVALPIDSNNLSRPSDTIQTAITIPSENNEARSFNGTHRSDSALYQSSDKKADTQIPLIDDLTAISGDQKFRFGVNVSPGVTSTATASSFNYSGGINADYSLSSIFHLSTGLQFEHLSVVNGDPVYDPSVPQGQTKAELVDLDIPLNITWKFLIRKSSSYYISSGISSVVYLSENYTNTSYSQQMVEVVEMKDGVENVTYQLENVKTTEQTTEEPLNTFDFASRINIIFGFEQHLSSKLFLHVEPYLKIPISEQATQNIKFTTGGISCKISF